MSATLKDKINQLKSSYISPHYCHLLNKHQDEFIINQSILRGVAAGCKSVASFFCVDDVNIVELWR